MTKVTLKSMMAFCNYIVCIFKHTKEIIEQFYYNL